MRYYHITNVLYIAMAVFIIIGTSLAAGLLLNVPLTQADEISPFVPFGGWVDSLVFNPVPAGAALCPVYALVTNADVTNGLPPEFGVFIPPAPPGPIYDYGNLFIPGTPLIGGLEPVPCPAPIPVFPLFYNIPFYLVGTGGIPGTY